VEFIAQLYQAGVLHSQGMSMMDAIRQTGVSEATFYQWCRLLSPFMSN
jgi:ACT domain-containing protein